MLLVGAIYIGLTWHHRALIVYADEPGYLGDARWLAGGLPWSMGKATSYQIGYPLLIAPIFALISKPENIYRVVILFNCLMCAALAGVLYLFAYRILYMSPIVALASSATASAYPALATQTGIAWAEIIAMLGIAAFVLTAWHLCRYPGYSPMLCCAAVSRLPVIRA